MSERAWLLLTLAAVGFVGFAVASEIFSSGFTNSPVPDWAELAPIAWPPAARVLWWLAVAGAAGLFRYGLHRLGMRQRPLVVAASVLPFVAFAGGIALGADWATWH